MCHSCLPTVNHYVLGRARTLSDMPNEILSGVISFSPDSVRALRAASRAFRGRAGEGFLLSHTAGIIAVCKERGSPLDRRIYSTFIRFSVHLWNQPDCFGIRFHLSVSEGIRALGVPAANCPDRILSCREISRYNGEVLGIQNPNLERIWTPLRQQILQTSPTAQVPGIGGVSAQGIRTWLYANQNLLLGIDDLYDLRYLQLTCVPAELGLCTGVQQLNLSHSQLSFLPEDLFSGMVNLRSLDLDYNQLVCLPEGLFSGLTQLEVLGLGNNQLTTLPARLFHGLPKLECLFVSRNPLMFSYDSIPVMMNNIALTFQMNDFFNYRCISPFAGVYQLAAGSISVVTVRNAFLQLPDVLKNSIYWWVWVKADRPQTPDHQWGEHHAFDDMGIFRRALREYVRESFEALSREQRQAVYGYVCDFARCEGLHFDMIPELEEARANRNILRFIDAMMKQRELP